MSELVRSGVFHDNGNPKRERENFQNFVFANLDLSKSDVPISFQRSDFRLAHISKCKFSRNNFGNCDFIDSVLKETIFEDCIFRYSEVYNAYFESSSLEKSLFSSASIVGTHFTNCNLIKTRFSICTFRDCTFKDSTISHCNFQRSSLDSIYFDKVTFNKVDLSGSTSINLYFDDCTFTDLTLDADYLGSYFFKSRQLQNIKLKYRGRVFKLDMGEFELFTNLFKILWEGHRYYEAINVLIQRGVFEGETHSIFLMVVRAIEELRTGGNPLQTMYQLEKFFKMFEYYFSTGYIPASDYFKFVEFMDDLQIEYLSLVQTIDIREKVFRLKSILIDVPAENKFIYTSTIPTFLEITIADEDKVSFEEQLSSIMESARQRLGINDPPYFVLNIRKGSLIYEVIIFSGVAFAMLRLIKVLLKEIRGISNEAMQFRIDYKCNTKMMKLLNASTSVDKIRKIRELQMLSEKVLSPQDAVSEADVRKILPLIKSISWHPNDLTNT